MINDASVQPIVDAEIVEPEEALVPEQPGTPSGVVEEASGASVLIDLENMIKNYISSLEANRKELKVQKEMLNDIFNNDPTYREQEAQVKDVMKAKKEIKARLSRQPNAIDLSEKVKNLTSEIREKDTALSDYLREYMRLSGANEIEDGNGVMHEIVYIAKLLKKPPNKLQAGASDVYRLSPV